MVGIHNLKNFITWATIVIILVMIVAYTLLIQFSMHSAIIDAAIYDLELRARDYNRDYSQNPSAPLPSDKYLKSFKDPESLPEWFTKRHSPSKLRSGKLVFGELEIDENFGGERFFYLGMAYESKDKEKLFMIQCIRESDDLEHSFQNWERTQILTLTTGIVFISLIGGALWLFFHRISKPIKELQEWASNLNREKLSDTLPSFHFDEINHLANFIKNSALDLQNALDREHQFLRNASHELRTPIAVIRSNIDLLDRIETNAQSRTNASYERIRRAADNIQQLTETLLWLSRKEETMPVAEKINLTDLVQEVIQENIHLLAGKSVSIEQNLKELSILLPRIAAHIILGNLIRNAFQYTAEGVICVSTTREYFSIQNTYTTPTPSNTSENHGFGLGLLLVQQICERLNIVYQNEKTPNGFCAILKFEQYR